MLADDPDLLTQARQILVGSLSFFQKGFTVGRVGIEPTTCQIMSLTL